MNALRHITALPRVYTEPLISRSTAAGLMRVAATLLHRAGELAILDPQSLDRRLRSPEVFRNSAADYQ
jgi:hypothetical protein